MPRPMVFYSGFVVLVTVTAGAVWAVLHVVKVVRKVRTPISDPFDVQSDDDLCALIEATEESDETDALIRLWESELAEDPGIRKYARQMDRRSR